MELKVHRLPFQVSVWEKAPLLEPSTLTKVNPPLDPFSSTKPEAIMKKILNFLVNYAFEEKHNNVQGRDKITSLKSVYIINSTITFKFSPIP